MEIITNQEFKNQTHQFLSALKKNFGEGDPLFKLTLKDQRLDFILDDKDPFESKREWLLWQFKKQFLQDLDQSKVAKNFPIVLLKGASLQEQVYPKGVTRPMTDIDLYMPFSSGHLKDYFQESGFQHHDEKKWYANAFKSVFVRPEHKLVVELHTKLSYDEVDHPHWPIEIHPNYTHLFRLKPEVELAYLTYHYAYQHTFLSLLWLFDIHLLIKRMTETQMKESFKYAQLLGSHKAHETCLKVLFDTIEDPKALLFEAKLGFKKDIIWNLPERKREYFLVKHLIKGNLFKALKYDLHWAWSRIWK